MALRTSPTTNDEEAGVRDRGPEPRPLRLLQKNAGVPAAYASSALTGWRRRRSWDDVETFCLFVGYPRSGHSLVGALLDAHEEATIAHELDVLRYLHAGFGRSQLYALITRNAERFTADGRRAKVDYTYFVPNQWHGRWTRLRVVGDKKGGTSTGRLQRHPELLDRLRDRVGVPVRLVHVVRNPFDNIATMLRRSTKWDLDDAVRAYFALRDGVEQVRERVPAGDVLDLRYEDVVTDPGAAIPQLCRFVGVGAGDDYVRDCASILAPEPSRSRAKVSWPSDVIRTVQDRIDRDPVLCGYRFDDSAEQGVAERGTTLG
jgi:hypothetical protein